MHQNNPDTRHKTQDPFLHIKITQAENDIFNWCRFRHRPAKMNAWVRETLLREALRMVSEANASGKDAPQGINELLERIKKELGARS
jgi:hypothetical protein